MSGTAPPHRRSSRLSGLAVVVVAGVLLAPMALVWLPGGRPAAASAAALPSIAWPALGASLAVATAAAALAVIVGALLAAAFTLTDLPGRRLWATLALLPFVAPPMVWALGQLYAFGPSGMVERWLGGAWRALFGLCDAGRYQATVVVLAEVHAPLAMLIVGRGMARLHHAGLASARLFLPPAGLARWIVGAVRTELAAAFLLAFALGLGNHAIPHVLQCRLYPVEIYLRMANYLDSGGALWTAVPLLAAAMAAAACLALVERPRGAALAGPAPAQAPIRLGRKTWIVAAPVLAYLGVTTLLPAAAMVAECRSPSLFVEALRAAAFETKNSLWIAGAAALVAAAAGLVAGAAAVRSARAAMHVLVLLPLGVPPILVGLAYAQWYNRDWPVDLSALGSAGALVVLGLACRGWPFAARIVAAGRRRIAPGWEEAAELAGLGRRRRWRWISGPLLAGPVLAGALVAFLVALGDVEITQMLAPPGSGTLALRLFAFLHFGPAHVAASLAVWQMVLAAVPVLVYFVVTNRTLEVV